jgi:LuxR family transcriptional regulator, maltose regulon positive regulatory protein
MQKADTLIRTKLHLPFTRPGLVSRPRLQEQIYQGLRGPLTLVTAPAGFGKSTLVASCVTGCGMAVAWLSLDKDDNHAESFLNYLVAALQKADNSIGIKAAQLLTGMQLASPEAVLTSLINDLDDVTGEIVLVLDDYQQINSQAVHEEMAFLLQHCPNSFHLVIATRSDPPFHLSSALARGRMVELRAADLSFTEPEATQFLNDVMGLGLDARLVSALEERTEGWIAGLQMAALSMQNRKDIDGFIKGFSGSNRYILDYLLEEVMAGQPPEIQRFLLCTSILERLTAPLCEAVLEAGKLDGQIIDKISANFQHPYPLGCQPILEYLDRANLFLVPLDDERTWYRYHHLFADLLHARLQQTLKSEEIAALHTRAAQWYNRNGFTVQAIHHASLTSNTEWVEQLIEQNYMEMFHRGEASAMRSWTGQLSKELIYRRPWLCIYEAQSHALFGQLDEAEVLIAKAEEHLQLENPAADIKSMLGHLAYVKSRVTGMRGDVQRAIELSLIARENTPASNQALQSGIGVMLGVGYFMIGDFPKSIQTFKETIQSSSAVKAINGTMAAYCHLARLNAIQGHLNKSYELYQEAGKFAREAGGRNLGAMSLVDVGIANVLYELNDLEAALARIKHGLDFIPLWGNADDIAMAYTTLARIQQSQGNIDGGLETVEKGIQLIQTRGVFSVARDAVHAARVRLWLAQGDLLSAGRWAASQEERLIPDTRFGFENELTRITLSRVYIAQLKPGEAIRLLTRLEESAESGGRTGRLIEILILKALTLQGLGKTALALVPLEKSLSQAEPEGYIRIFVHEGASMQSLLAQWLAHASSGPVRDYASHLLSQFAARSQGSAAAPGKVPPDGNQFEPLTRRELEVLSLLAAGLSNQQIAEKLIISLGTVKFYVHAIMQKFGVHSRTQAILIAKERNLQ